MRGTQSSVDTCGAVLADTWLWDGDEPDPLAERGRAVGAGGAATSRPFDGAGRRRDAQPTSARNSAGAA